MGPAHSIQDVRGHQQSSIVLQLIVGAALISAFVIVLAVSWLKHSREQDISDAGVSTNNLAKVLEHDLSGTIASIDVALQAVAYEFATLAATGSQREVALNRLLASQQSYLPNIDSLRIADSEGRVRYGRGIPSGSSVNVADRDYFIAARDGSNALHISKPLLPRITKKWAIVLARRLDNRDGSFAGVVYANLGLAQLGQVLASIDVGPHGVVSLRDHELGLIVRYPEAKAVGIDVGSKLVSKELQNVADTGMREATYLTPTSNDNVARIVSVRRMAAYPFHVIVGMANEDFLAEWYHQVVVIVLSLVSFHLLLLFGVRFLLGAHRRQLASEWQLRSIIAAEPECVKVLSTDGTVRQMNPAGLAMFEADSEDQIVGRPMAGIVAPAHREAVQALNERVNQGQAGSLEFEIIGLRGTRRWLETHAVPMRDAAGHVTGLLGVTRDITERKKAHEALQRSENRLKEAQRIAQIGDWELDLESQTMTCSDAALEIFEIAGRGDVISYEEFLSHVDGEDRDGVAQALIEAIRNHRPFDQVHRVRTTDGTVKHVHELSKPYYRDDGKALRVVGTVQDVTMETLMVQSIQESEERFKTIADFNYDWEYWRGPRKEFLYISPSCERITGYSQTEFISDNALLERIVHPDDQELMATHLTHYQDDVEHSLDIRIIRKDGGIRWLAHGCRAVFGKDGTFQGRRVSNRDITERKAAEQMLHESEERFRLISTTAQDAIIIVGPDEAISYWNPAAEAIFGYPAEEALGQNLHAMLPPSSLREGAHHGFADFAKTGQGILVGKTHETSALRKGGEEFPIELSISAILIKGAWHAMGIVRDVTERKSAEEKIRSLAYFDTLTELPNRRLLMDRLNQGLSQARRFARGLAVMFLDLDHFKEINDTLGHDAGDELLLQVARRLNGCVRAGDTVARLGGDEFVIVLAELAQASDAVNVAEKVIEALGKPFEIGGTCINATTSIGISVYAGQEQAEDAETLIKRADSAMYQAKQGGRNRFRFHSEEAR